MSLNSLLRILENNPTEQDLRDILPEIIDHLRDHLKPCQCCSRQGKYGCSGGCGCSQPAPDICMNCNHTLKEHLVEECTGKWSSPHDLNRCPCKKFIKSCDLGDR